MSQDNVELIERGLARFMTTGEPQWEMFDEDVAIYDRDTPDQGVYRGHSVVARCLRTGEPRGLHGASSPRSYNDRQEALKAMGLAE